MKKIKNLFYLFIFTFMIFLPSNSYANEIYNIDVEAIINNDGSMDITQVWHVNADENTEFYIPMQNLNRMEIENYRVSMNGQAFRENPHWDIHASFEEKAYTYGINTSEGYPELCFGISEYGENTYIIEYTFTNAVQAYPDADGFNIRFINDEMNPSPHNVSVAIAIPGINLNESNSSIYGFGFHGDISFDNGKIYAYTDSFDYHSHLTIVAGFEKAMIDPIFEGDGTFEDLVARAMEGSDYDVEEENGGLGGFIDRLMDFILRHLWLIIAIGGLIGAFINSRKSKKKNIPQNLHLVDLDDGYYYRDPPLNNQLPSISVMNEDIEGVVDLEDKFENLMSSYLLKWLNEGSIRVHSSKKGLIFKKDAVDIEFLSEPDFLYKSEKDLYNYFKSAAKDNLLEESELKKYIEKNYTEFDQIRNTAHYEGENYLEDNGYIYYDYNDHLYLTESGIEEARNTNGYKNFLQDFTLVNEREPVEVKLWDNILILAALFGLADTVAKQFDSIYPEYSFSPYRTSPARGIANYYYISRLSSFSHTANASYVSVQKARSSGSGGPSSFGGGGGFSGGGSGGGSR